MIKEIPSAYKGTVTTDIEIIKGEIASAILHKLEQLDIPRAKEEKQSWKEHDSDLRMLFGSKYISLNTKNIEYLEEYNLSDYVITSSEYSNKAPKRAHIKESGDSYVLDTDEISERRYWPQCLRTDTYFSWSSGGVTPRTIVFKM